MKKCMTWLMAALCSVAVAAPAMAADTIKIGVQGAHSGDLASYGVPSLNAAKIVIEEANAKGGVLGKKIELVSQDDQCKPELATNAATKLISDKVVAIMGPICSGATNASLPMYESANIISISPTATTPALTLEGKHPLFLRTVTTEDGLHAKFYYSLDGQNFLELAEVPTNILTDEQSEGFTGAHFGMYCHDMTGGRKWADFDYFEILRK